MPVIEHDRELRVVERAVLEVLREPEAHRAVAQVLDRSERPERRLRARGVGRPGDEPLEWPSEHGRAAAAAIHGGTSDDRSGAWDCLLVRERNLVAPPLSSSNALVGGHGGRARSGYRSARCRTSGGSSRWTTACGSPSTCTSRTRPRRGPSCSRRGRTGRTTSPTRRRSTGGSATKANSPCAAPTSAGSGRPEGVAEDEYTDRELRDHVATIAWLAEQEWSNGNVGMYGTSYSASTASRWPRSGRRR